MIRRLFTFQGTVGRRFYFTAGLTLMVAKYAVDAIVIGLVVGVPWTPVDYLTQFHLWTYEREVALSGAFIGGLVLWAMPFMWIGVSMTLRRLIDAGRGPWLVLLFFLPFVNYALMLYLSIVPSAPERGEAELDRRQDPTKRMVMAASAGALIAGALVVVSLFVFGAYGLTVFMLSPFVLGLVAAFVFNRGRPAAERSWGTVVLVAVTIMSGGLLLFAIEGMICIVMALPLGVPLALLGGLVGQVVASRCPPAAGLAAILVGFGVVQALDSKRPAPAVIEAVSVIEIDAPISMVWSNVVDFEEIEGTPAWYFRMGIAYPVRATIDGSGVGAVRYCEFSTGAFVEPITVWDEPYRLAFDVVEQPPSMTEISPFPNVQALHLDGYFSSVRGEFRLIELDPTVTRLEGSTWYQLDIYPHIYWRPITEFLLDRIHHRVLDQISVSAVRQTGNLAADG